MSAQTTENDAKTQTVLLNLETIQKNKKLEEQEENFLAAKNKTNMPGADEAQRAAARPHT